MIKTLRNKLIVFLVVALCCITAIIGINYFAVAKAENSGFDETYGAGVRLVENSSGIRFRAIVQESFVNDIKSQYPNATLNYYGKINAVGADDSKAVKGKVVAPKFVDEQDADEAAEINVSVIYNKLAESKKAAAYAVDLFAEFYIEVCDVNGAILTTVEATGATGNYSMRSAANNAALHWEEGLTYDLEDLYEYFTPAANSEVSTGFVATNGKAEISFPKLSLEEGTKTKIYINGVGVSATFTGGEFVVESGANLNNYVNGSAGNAVYFTPDGKAYNTKFTFAQHVDASNISKMLHVNHAAGESIYLALTEDVDMASVTWAAHESYSVAFRGTFDGAGHTISNFTTNSTVQCGALFGRLVGATVKNLAITNATVVASSSPYINGVLCRGLDNATVENVYIHAKSVGSNNTSPLAGVIEKNNNTIKNTVIEVDSAVVNGNNNFLSGYYGGQITVDNLRTFTTTSLPLFSAGIYAETSGYGVMLGTDGSNAESGVDYINTNYEGDYINGVINDKRLPNFIVEAVKTTHGVININKANLSSIRDYQTGYLLLTEDIDTSDVTWAADTKLNTFAGIFDGNGHTISNFTTNSTSQKGSLFYKVSGTIKNLAITKATVTGTINGVLARGLQDGAVVENVYIHAASVSSNSGAVAGVVEMTGATLKDVTVVIDSMTKHTYSNVICGQYGGNITFENCYFSAPSNVDTFSAGSLGASGGIIVGVLDTDYFRFNSAIELLSKVNGDKNAMTEFVTESLYKNQRIELNGENFLDIQNLTGGYVILTEDIDMNDINWALHTTDYRTHYFTGVFDGQGYTISNFTVPTGGNHNGALFHNVKGGTIKNLVLTNVTGWSNDGVIASRTTDATFENLYVQIDEARCNSFGGIVGAAGGTNTFKDIYVQLDATTYKATVNSPVSVGTNAGMLTGLQSGTIVVDNVIAVNDLGMDLDGASATAIYGADGVTVAVSGTDYVIYTDPTNVSTSKLTTDLLLETYINNYEGEISAKVDKYTNGTSNYLISAYSATNDDWIMADGVKYFLVDNGDGTIIFVPEDELTQDMQTVSMMTLENIQRYADANFTTLYIGSANQYMSTDSILYWMDVAEDLGLKCFVFHNYVYLITNTPWNNYEKTTVIDPENADGRRIFASQEELNAYVKRNLPISIITHPAYAGTFLRDEPQYPQFGIVGEVLQAVLAAYEDAGVTASVKVNLLPFQHASKLETYKQFSPENYMNQTGIESYKDYLNEYYDKIGQYTGEVCYDKYPLMEGDYILETYLIAYQTVTEFAREKGLNFAHVFQTDQYNTRRAPTENDVWWQTTVGMAMGVNNFWYYTYYPSNNTGGSIESNMGEDNIVDRFGNPNSLYYTVQDINAEISFLGKAMSSFSYVDLKYFVSGSPDMNVVGVSEGYVTKQGTLTKITNADVNFDKDAVILVTEFIDEETNQIGYYIANITDPTDAASGEVTITLEDADFAQVWQNGTNKIRITKGSVTLNLGVGRGAFIIPYTLG